jgi:hypothetical protein
MKSLCHPATRLNNDADADASQDRKVEKAEKLYRTATVQKIMPRRLTKSDHACAMR